MYPLPQGEHVRLPGVLVQMDGSEHLPLLVKHSLISGQRESHYRGRETRQQLALTNASGAASPAESGWTSAAREASDRVCAFRSSVAATVVRLALVDI
jgi:hypothetical protein